MEDIPQNTGIAGRATQVIGDGHKDRWEHRKHHVLGEVSAVTGHRSPCLQNHTASSFMQDTSNQITVILRQGEKFGHCSDEKKLNTIKEGIVPLKI